MKTKFRDFLLHSQKLFSQETAIQDFGRFFRYLLPRSTSKGIDFYVLQLQLNCLSYTHTHTHTLSLSLSLFPPPSFSECVSVCVCVCAYVLLCARVRVCAVTPQKIILDNYPSRKGQGWFISPYESWRRRKNKINMFPPILFKIIYFLKYLPSIQNYKFAVITNKTYLFVFSKCKVPNVIPLVFLYHLQL